MGLFNNMHVVVIQFDRSTVGYLFVRLFLLSCIAAVFRQSNTLWYVGVGHGWSCGMSADETTMPAHKVVAHLSHPLGGAVSSPHCACGHRLAKGSSSVPFPKGAPWPLAKRGGVLVENQTYPPSLATPYVRRTGPR